MYKLKKYHGDLVQSLEFEIKGKQASIGIVGVGEFDFGTINAETIKVTNGCISVWHEENNRWIEVNANEEFRIPAQANYKLKAKEISTYICFYE
jgi:uncharacterized protein YaiE (UPF0345 family)